MGHGESRAGSTVRAGGGPTAGEPAGPPALWSESGACLTSSLYTTEHVQGSLGNVARMEIPPQ